MLKDSLQRFLASLLHLLTFAIVFVAAASPVTKMEVGNVAVTMGWVFVVWSNASFCVELHDCGLPSLQTELHTTHWTIETPKSEVTASWVQSLFKSTLKRVPIEPILKCSKSIELPNARGIAAQ